MLDPKIFKVAIGKKFGVKRLRDDNDSESAEDEFGNAIKAFLLAVNSLVDGIPRSLHTLDRAFRRASSNFDELIAPYILEGPLEEHTHPRTVRFRMPPSKDYLMRRLEQRVNRCEHALRAVSESFLVALVTQFDTFVGALVRAVLTARPEILNTSERALTFAELKTFGSLEDAQQFLIDKEVDQLLRRSHSEYIEWFEKRSKKTKEGLQARLGPWQYFTEVVQRRNIIVHSDSVVSKQYFEECTKAGLRAEELPPLGSRLEITLDYYAHAYQAVVEVGLRLGLLTRLNFKPENEASVLDQFQALAVDQMTERRNELANKLLLFSSNLCQDKSAVTKQVMAVNLAQSYKWLGDEAAMHKVLNGADFSATDDIFRLAVATLKEDWPAIDKWTRKLALVGDANPNWYREWPLFQRIRDDERFLALFQEIYAEPLFEKRDGFNEAIVEGDPSEGTIRASRRLTQVPPS